MNKTLTINLGGLPFIIDEDAYQYLEDYLRSIHAHFRSSEGYEEITGDIEARMAELFREQQGHGAIVELQTVKNVVQIMGTPEAFGAEPMGARAETKTEEGEYRTGKRLFRNPENKKVAGVCSGLAAYFGVEDPVWIRLLFVALFFGTGVGALAYILIWALAPEAHTAADRLAMHGRPVNVTTIGKQIEEELESVKKIATDLGEELQMVFSKKR